MTDGVPLAFAGHPRCVDTGEGRRFGEWRYILRSKHDDARLLQCHVFAFDLNPEHRTLNPEH